MGWATEKRLLQAAIAIGCLVPLLAGGYGMIVGPAFVRGVGSQVATDLDSHFRYLSGLLIATGLLFASCVPGVEARGTRLRHACFLVMIGGLGRAWSLAHVGLPGIEHCVGLGLELVGAPAVMLWQARVARIMGARSPA